MIEFENQYVEKRDKSGGDLPANVVMAETQKLIGISLEGSVG